MRELKFRLYSNYYKKMFLYDPQWGNYSHGDGWVGAIPFEDERVTYAPSNRQQLEPEGCEWMQFTGLSDKNGKEIYEGDLVVLSGVLEDEVKVTCRAVMDGWQATFESIVKGDGFYCPMGSTEQSYREVIGNIYENPELLGQLSRE